ncbi:MAG: CocE/NonD family hydrolase [Actinobacteria bacterium]|nr:CocE/NonD family hydrolase [Actinomycetota bacterium]
MRLRTALSGLLAPVLAASLLAAHDAPRDAGPPADFIAMADQLSQPDYPDTVTVVEQLVVPHDDVDIYVEITKPDPELHGDGPWPVILEASPYHGTIATRIGDRMFPDPKNPDGSSAGLTGYFAPRGYAVAMMDLRGTGRSGGCLDHLGPNDAKDLEYTIEWLASQEWSNGRVGMTGHSYVGSTPSVAAAQRPDGLVTIIPSAGLASMYDHQFLYGVPWLLQYVGPQAAYATLATQRHMPSQAPAPPVISRGDTGDDFGNHPTDTGCGWKSSAALSGPGQYTGQYERWHAERDWRALASEADIPVFMIHGVNDNAARIPAAEWFFGHRFMRPGDKVWIGQWDHGSTNGRCGDVDNKRVSHPTCRFDQMKYAIHAWFDKHLKQMDVDTGPAVEAFLNAESARPTGSNPNSPTNDPLDPMSPEWGRTAITDTAWRHPDHRVELHADGEALSFAQPSDEQSRTFTTNANAVLAHVGSGSVTFLSDPLDEDLVTLGLMRMQLTASVRNSQVVHLVATLSRRDPATGQVQDIGYCGIQPSLRDSVSTFSPIVPDQAMTLHPQCFTVAHHVPAGQQLLLTIGTNGKHFASHGSERQVTIYTGPDHTKMLLPVVEDAVIHPDVSLREQ